MILLDDYGMLLLEKTQMARDDYLATSDERSAEQDRVLKGGARAERSLYLSRSLREREDLFIDLAIDLVGYIWMLEAYPELARIRHMSHHITLTDETIALVDQLREHVEVGSAGSLAVLVLRDTVLPAMFTDAARK